MLNVYKRLHKQKKEFGDESATSSNNPDPPRSTNSTGSELNAKQRKPTNWKENHNHENTKVNLILICTFKNSYSSSFQKCNCWTRHINIKSLFRAVRMMESTRCRYSVVSFLSRSDHNRETTTTNGRDLTTTRPACAPSITRPWIMECEKKLPKD